jgi:hypothetical protein
MTRRGLSVRNIIFFGGAVLMLTPALVTGTLYTGALQKNAEKLLFEKLATRGELGSDLLAHHLYELWQQVNALAQTFPLQSLTDVQRNVDLLGGLDRRYSWLGVTDVKGDVVVALKGMLLSQNVSARPWFKRGLVGPTAVDVHEAQLLSKLLPATTEPYRFIDLAAPIHLSEKTVSGVVGAHVDWRWVVENLKRLEAPGIDIVLLSREQTVLYGPSALLDKKLTIGSAEGANRAARQLLTERWPDGKDYISVVVPTVAHLDLPSFGWSILVRQNRDEALEEAKILAKSFWFHLGSGAFIALALLFLVATWITTPLRRLMLSAEAMTTTGADTRPPYSETRYQEVSRLSDALVRIQAKDRNFGQ